MKPVRVLHVLGGTSLGGAESRIMDIYRHIDRDLIQFDFLVHSDESPRKPQFFDEEIARLGGQIYVLPKFKVYNLGAYKKAVNDFFAAHHEYVAVHGHMTSTASIYLPIAKKHGISMTIAHARSAGVDKGIKGTVTKLLRRNLVKCADYSIACSYLAAESVFGVDAAKNGLVRVVPNAIDPQVFSYNREMRYTIRQELGLEKATVIGHVGRFHYAKNHEYLIEIFAKYLDINPDARLMLLGEGEGMEAIKQQALDLGISDKVLFMGNRRDVWNYYQAMDLFCFPSRFEGLPGTVVEAQAAGLACVVSDQITREVGITDRIEFMPIDVDASEWAHRIQDLISKQIARQDMTEIIKSAGFDVNEQTKMWSDFYTGKENRS